MDPAGGHARKRLWAIIGYGFVPVRRASLLAGDVCARAGSGVHDDGRVENGYRGIWMTDTKDAYEAQTAEEQPVGSACPLGSCRPRGWILWGGLILLGALYVYSNRSVPAAFEWIHDPEVGLAKARQANRPVFVDFYADWCGVCKSMDREVFSRPEVAQAMEKWIPLQIDVDRYRDIARQYGVEALPTLVALTPEGKVIARHEGYMSAEALITFLQRHGLADRSLRPPSAPRAGLDGRSVVLVKGVEVPPHNSSAGS